MSRINIERYYKEVDDIIRFGGSRKETSIRGPFQKLLNSYCEMKDFILITELEHRTPSGSIVYPDGTVKDALRLDWGYWESKDTDDDLDVEIDKKFAKGYPSDNIIFEDSVTAILIQGGVEKLRVRLKDEIELDRLLTSFINYERPEVRSFRDAIEKFKEDIPTILETLRVKISEQAKTNKNFRKARDNFLTLCKEVINPAVNQDDIREMMIQHILTDEIFTHVYGESHFHKENNIAHQLQLVIDTFFIGQVRREILSSIESYYKVIKREASNITNHKEKQKFLKVIYENFYKVYNPKGADKLGIIYTPDEIVNFMIESTDYLLNKHFGKLLSDHNVEILDPATGTGTFVTDIIDYISPDKLEYKYDNELHANEVAILPYYVANLNIEYTFKQKTGKYKEFKNICFVDTLENLGFEMEFGHKVGRNLELFGGLSAENLERIKRQNKKEITVIIGNPPYNANQQNFNDLNKNREYPEIDERIRMTFVKESRAQKTKAYDMYSRFYRWAMDRIGDNGIIAFVTNNSFIDSGSYDGFRKVVADNFNEIWIVDLKGDARTSGERRRREGGNVFDDKIREGIAIFFLVKNKNYDECNIYYNAVDEYIKSPQKRAYLHEYSLKELKFEHIQPSQEHNWVNIANTDFINLLQVLKTKFNHKENAIFDIHTPGVNTARDPWVFDFDKNNLIKKAKYLSKTYNQSIREKALIEKIKWSDGLSEKYNRQLKSKFSTRYIKMTEYRPFATQFHYTEKTFNDRLTINHYKMYGTNLDIENPTITFSGKNHSKQFQVLAVKRLFGFDFLEKTQCIPLHRYDEYGNRFDNITDWGLKQFQIHYQDPNIRKESIFHYIYAVLNNRAYREKYELNLRRSFPRLPFYDNFWKWANWGEELMNLHIDYQSLGQYTLKVETKDDNKSPKPKLKVNKEQNSIILDTHTKISGIPSLAWEYKLGNRSALEWILDQYKEKKPKDPTIREKFNTYKFAGHKDHVIDLIKRVTTVSVRTVEIMKEMEQEKN